MKMHRFAKKIYRFFILHLIILIVFLGGWCIPPRMMEKVIQRLKQKVQSESLFEGDIDGQIS